eukprot:CAMPEP_0202975020 /NCGR_PEP_ID=MMETSP1396-20130829/65850_1 /ASSEMBLY_ACC=CAM_ASM_000872 /TAXON_ID= /ORGANISM="Pseudokeronopsis sp., Strain Brazil" /LENGTH=56 /DNA_ID=CAMNT_0049709921 /DNA_START=333 /DNA_END=503 /DNA_ORIENTATION=-
MGTTTATTPATTTMTTMIIIMTATIMEEISAACTYLLKTTEATKEIITIANMTQAI